MRETLCIAIVGTLLIAAMTRRRGRWSEDIRSQKPLLCRPRHWNRDSYSCEHEKLSDGAVAAVICCLTFS
jgi:hypothetical protein